MGATIKVAGWVALGAVAGALTTMQLTAIARSPAAALPLEELQQLAAVFGMVKSDYVEPVDEKKLITDAIGGMVAGLDPHSQYFDKKTFKEFREGTSGKFVGVGIEIGMEDGLVKVVTPIEGSPAYRAGLKTGDLITKIDDTFVKGLTMDQAVKRMRGEPNTKVLLQVFRKTESRSFPVTIVREEIRMQSVRAKIAEPGYAWLRVSQFQDRTVDDFVGKLAELYKQDPNLKGIVLDLRNDPGGLLEASVAISAAFLPKDVTVVSTNGQIAESKAVFKASPEFYTRRGSDPLAKLPAALKTVPLVVLVNEGSASASEIVAGALQDHKRAVVMGSQTFGKGSVQTVRPLGPDTGLKLTTARYYTPSGKSIQARGIVPDVMVDESEEGNVFSVLR
ncbi:MAG TPA: S41 family peptidase, partial [Methylibium sp.]|nr:S41 family peptidase [Methylibium sp.]